MCHNSVGGGPIYAIFGDLYEDVTANESDPKWFPWQRGLPNRGHKI